MTRRAFAQDEHAQEGEAMPDAPLSHIARAVLPWRDPADNDTECGKHVADFAKVITWDEARVLVKKHGRQRAAFVLCMTCVETTRRHGSRTQFGQVTFTEEPVERLSREFGKRRSQTDAELRAMAEIVRRYPDEFADLLAGRVMPIEELRRVRRGQRV